ncbi:MAG: YkgJ family cysteine cluster protein [Thermodesulfatator sp.]|nr:MAG: YkgJ family cysteine cluster protein [Thermodesulfatator sp.]
MEEPVFDPRELGLEDEFLFACHPGVPCFNKCCYDIHLVLPPYDFLRLRRALGLSPEEFIERYGEAYIGEVTQLPVVSVYMQSHDFACPFLTPQGCRVYPDRPSACRTYPLARFLREDPETGKRQEVYRIIRETHCKGHYEKRPITVREYLREQGLEPYLYYNDLFGEVVARRQAHAETPLTGDQLDLIFLALYDLPAFRREIQRGHLAVELPGPVEDLSEEALLEVGIRFVLEKVLIFD